MAEPGLSLLGDLLETFRREPKRREPVPVADLPPELESFIDRFFKAERADELAAILQRLGQGTNRTPDRRIGAELLLDQMKRSGIPQDVPDAGEFIFESMDRGELLDPVSLFRALIPLDAKNPNPEVVSGIINRRVRDALRRRRPLVIRDLAADEIFGQVL